MNFEEIIDDIPMFLIPPLCVLKTEAGYIGINERAVFKFKRENNSANRGFETIYVNYNIKNTSTGTTSTWKSCKAAVNAGKIGIRGSLLNRVEWQYAIPQDSEELPELIEYLKARITDGTLYDGTICLIGAFIEHVDHQRNKNEVEIPEYDF